MVNFTLKSAPLYRTNMQTAILWENKTMNVISNKKRGAKSSKEHSILFYTNGSQLNLHLGQRRVAQRVRVFCQLAIIMMQLFNKASSYGL